MRDVLACPPKPTRGGERRMVGTAQGRLAHPTISSLTSFPTRMAALIALARPVTKLTAGSTKVRHDDGVRQHQGTRVKRQAEVTSR